MSDDNLKQGAQSKGVNGPFVSHQSSNSTFILISTKHI